MNIDKIKYLMDKNIFNYWTALSNGILPYEDKIYFLKTAEKKLQKGIKEGILIGEKYIIELNYIKMLLK